MYCKSRIERIIVLRQNNNIKVISDLIILHKAEAEVYRLEKAD